MKQKSEIYAINLYEWECMALPKSDRVSEYSVVNIRREFVSFYYPTKREFMRISVRLCGAGGSQLMLRFILYMSLSMCVSRFVLQSFWYAERLTSSICVRVQNEIENHAEIAKRRERQLEKRVCGTWTCHSCRQSRKFGVYAGKACSVMMCCSIIHSEWKRKEEEKKYGAHKNQASVYPAKLSSAAYERHSIFEICNSDEFFSSRLGWMKTKKRRRKTDVPKWQIDIFLIWHFFLSCANGSMFVW